MTTELRLQQNSKEVKQGVSSGAGALTVAGRARAMGSESSPIPEGASSLISHGAGSKSFLKPCGGQSGGLSSADGAAAASLLDSYVISARKATPATGDNSDVDKTSLHNDDKSERRVRRFYQRYFTGVGVGGRLRFLTLTTSDEALNEKLDIHRSFRALVMRLRRRWGAFEYMGVREVKGDRQHLHLVFRGEFMHQAQISAMWQAIHKSPIVDIRAMWKVRGGARELAKYLARQARNRYWASYNWVFRGWVGWSQRVKRVVGHYPGKALLRSLARLDKVKRRLAIDFFEWQYPALWQYSFERGELCLK